ncbi:MAG: hypothetical protein RR367_08295 [Clostridia bacterium]
MKRFLSLLLASLLLFSAATASAAKNTPTDAPTDTADPSVTPSVSPSIAGTITPAIAPAQAEENYSVAVKLLRQLWAGSGFSSTLTLKIDPKAGRLGEGVTTQKPLVFDIDYIYVRPMENELGEHRADVTLMDGETAQTAAHLQLNGNRLSVQADLLGTDWYALGKAATSPDAPAGESDSAATETPSIAEVLATLAPTGESTSVVREKANELLGQTGMPAILGFMLPLLAAAQNGTDMSELLTAYTTRIDLWLEGYRQNAVLNKLEDGSTTMQVQYSITPAAIKAQAKQLVLDLLSDAAALKQLQDLIGEEKALLYLNPQLQPYYFAAIDALPLTGDLTIERTVSLKGETLALHLSLPMYDSVGGNVVLRFDRNSGVGDLPAENTLSVDGDSRAITLEYQQYSSMTDVTVWQGTLLSQPKGDLEQKALAVNFSLTQQEKTGVDENARETYDYSVTLMVSPDTEAAVEGMEFPETEVALTSRFASKADNKASTQVDATLTIGGEGWAQTLTATLTGKSRKQWEPAAIPEARIDMDSMTQADWDALLPGVIMRSGLVLLQYFNLPMEDAASVTPGVGATATAEPTASPTPETFETIAP